MQVSSETGVRPFAEPHETKYARLLRELSKLTTWHAANCAEYRRILEVIYDSGPSCFGSISELPFLPVRLFKMLELRSVPATAVVKTLTSSGTTSQHPSRIFLDKETAFAQAIALTNIMKSFLGSKRLPMAIVDCQSVLKDRSSFSARGAGILGFSQLGRDHVYLLDNSMRLDWTAVDSFLARHIDTPVLLFGFTFMIWRYLYQASMGAGRKLDLSHCTLIHGGGWKKLDQERISNEKFKARLEEQFGIRCIHNYYGMVEQTGSIFVECERGYFHSSFYSDVLVRDPDTLEVIANGQTGVLQVFSSIPKSYPGHVLLSEDLATIVGEDDCACGRYGKYLLVHGRLPHAELRGCSDVHPEAL